MYFKDIDIHFIVIIYNFFNYVNKNIYTACLDVHIFKEIRDQYKSPKIEIFKTYMQHTKVAK